jgi:penicillin-binding protein 1C
MSSKTNAADRALRRLRWAALVAGGAALVLVLGALGLRCVPLPAALLSPEESPPVLVDREGRPLRAVRGDDQRFQRRVAYAEIPPALVDATLAAEDHRFWQHPGVDWRGSLRATVQLIRNRRIISGGSTVTQQLIKLAEPRPRTFRTKAIEAIQALRLEQVWDKPRIIAEYLNRIEYGNINAGCSAAAEFYFAKPLRDLSPAECALLAALPQAPSRLNPHAHFERACKRQQWILSQMFRAGRLTETEYRRSCAEPLRLAAPRRVFEAPHFVDLVLSQMQSQSINLAQVQTRPIASDLGQTGGPTPRQVRTSLDLELNRFVEAAVNRHLSRLQARQVRNASAVVIHNPTGEVLALVGSENYFDPLAGQVNGAWAPRSAGSTFKPFTYLVAFENGMSPATVVADVPTEFSTVTGLFAPVNFDHHCYGPMRYRLALANSLNIPAVKVLAAIGGPEILQQRLRSCGLSTLDQPADHYGLGLTIGNAEARLLELANAYACLARLGLFMPYQLLKPDPPLPTRSPSPLRIASADAAYLVADILSDNDARALAFGVDTPLRFSFPVACKTGTSSDFRDNWAFGYTPEFTVGVWVGNFDGSPMRTVSGVAGAAPLLHALVEHLHQHYGTTWYLAPPGITEAWIHPLTGKRGLDSGPNHLAGPPLARVREKFIATNLPPEETAADYDATGRILLAHEYREWLASSDNWLADCVALETSASSLRIKFPRPGTIFYLDPDLPHQGRRIHLQAEGAFDLEWHSDSLACQRESNHNLAWLTAGQHRLSVRSPSTHQEVQTWIQVQVR